MTKKAICGFLKALLPVFFVFSPVSTLYCSDAFYTIQAGTYNQNSLDFAADYFNQLSQKLAENERHYLRIEKGRRYYILRVGRFRTLEQARTVLKNIKLLSPDAFILKDTDFEFSKVFIFYDNSEINAAKTQKNLPLQPSRLQSDEKIYEKKISDLNEKQSDGHNRNAGIRPAPEENNSVDKLLDDISAIFYKQDYATAVSLLKSGLQKWPEDPILHAWYGATLLNTGLHDMAYEEYRKAAELLPDMPEAHAGAGHSLIGIYLEKAKASVDAFKKALEIDPDNISALEGLGIVYVSMDKKNLAAEIHERLQTLDRDAAARLNQFIVFGLDWGIE